MTWSGNPWAFYIYQYSLTDCMHNLLKLINIQKKVKLKDKNNFLLNKYTY